MPRPKGSVQTTISQIVRDHRWSAFMAPIATQANLVSPQIILATNLHTVEIVLGIFMVFQVNSATTSTVAEGLAVRIIGLDLVEVAHSILVTDGLATRAFSDLSES